MTEREIEKLVLGIDENPTKAWKEANKRWKGGALLMPEDEVIRRKEAKKLVAKILTSENINPEEISDAWLAGKVRRLLK